MDSMGTGFGVFIMMNNYFHDVATALLLATGLVLWIIVRRYRETAAAGEPGPDTKRYFLRVTEGLGQAARFSLWWILLGGIPRTICYRSFEWANAVDHAQVPALILKHILAFVFVAGGALLWNRYGTEARRLAGELPARQYQA